MGEFIKINFKLYIFIDNTYLIQHASHNLFKLLDVLKTLFFTKS